MRQVTSPNFEIPLSPKETCDEDSRPDPGGPWYAVRCFDNGGRDSREE